MSRVRTRAEIVALALDEIAQTLANEYELSEMEVEGIAADLVGEWTAYAEEKSERDDAAAYDPERIAASDEGYRRDMIAAGRGGLLK